MAASQDDSPSIHATAVLVGARAVLIRGPAGAGKSMLALRLIQAAAASYIPFARLVGDDRIHAEQVHGRLLIRPAAALRGLLEIRGLGIEAMPYEPVAVAGGIIDLVTGATPRLPEAHEAEAIVGTVPLPRLAVAQGADALPAALAFTEKTWGSRYLGNAPI